MKANVVEAPWQSPGALPRFHKYGKKDTIDSLRHVMPSPAAWHGEAAREPRQWVHGRARDAFRRRSSTRQMLPIGEPRHTEVADSTRAGSAQAATGSPAGRSVARMAATGVGGFYLSRITTNLSPESQNDSAVFPGLPQTFSFLLFSVKTSDTCCVTCTPLPMDGAARRLQHSHTEHHSASTWQ